jgi:hypothetical protein
LIGERLDDGARAEGGRFDEGVNMCRPLRTAMSFCQMTSFAFDHLDPVRLETTDELLPEAAVHGFQWRLKEGTAVAEVEHADAELPRLQMFEHDS